MHSTEGQKLHFQTRQGMTLVEVMISVAIFSLLGLALWTNVSLHQRSFASNRIRNLNAVEASFVVNRLLYGSDDVWGLRIASRTESTVAFTGLTGPQGQAGWQAVLRHGIEENGQDLPDLLDLQELVVTFNPLNRTIDVNDTVIGEDVSDSYFSIQNPSKSPPW